MADDDEDMAWRDAVPMPVDVQRELTQQHLMGMQQSYPQFNTQQAMMQHLLGMQQMLPYNQFHAAAQALQQQQLLAQQAMGMQQMYLEQGGMFSHGAHWPSGQTFCGSSPYTAYPANAGWSLGYAGHTSGGTIYCALAPVEDAGIRAGEVEGFRAWKIGGRGRTLHSMVNHAEWPPDGIMRGMPGDHDGMGVHAFKDEREARGQYNGEGVAFGRVALWGAIVEHEDGYRAEFARITAIDSVHGVWLSWSLRRLRRHYGLTGNE